MQQDELVRLCTLVNNFSPLYEGNFKIAMDEVNTYVSKLVDVASVAIRCQLRLRRHGLAPCARVHSVRSLALPENNRL